METSTQKIEKLIELMNAWGMMDNLSANEKETIIFEIQQIQIQTKRDTIQVLVNDLNK